MTDPRAIKIRKRDIRFDLTDVNIANWHATGTHVCHYFNVQSLLFPQGERFFIRSVRRFRNEITDPELLAQVSGFIGQEAMHGREHESYNQKLADIGYRVEQAEDFLINSFKIAERYLSPKMLLAMTVGLEHLTAIGAEDTLADKRFFSQAHPEMARLWRWHALEEIEHKAVAFDVYTAVAGTGLLAWLRRCLAFIFVSFSMQFTIWIGLLRVIRRSGGLFDLRGWWKLLQALWITPGFLRRSIPRYFQFFRPGFHPWNEDNYHLVTQWEREYSK